MPIKYGSIPEPISAEMGLKKTKLKSPDENIPPGVEFLRAFFKGPRKPEARLKM